MKNRKTLNNIPLLTTINSEIKDTDGGTPILDKNTKAKITEKKILDAKNLLKK